MGDPAVERAVALSVFADLPPGLRAAVLAGHRDATYAAGASTMPLGLPERLRTALVVSGLLRLQLEAPDGRRIAARYCGSGYFIGAAVLFPTRKQVRLTFDFQAIARTRVLHLDRTRLRTAAEAETGVALALLRQTAEYQIDMAHGLAGTAFGSVVERTAMHLLDLSVVTPDGSLVVPVTQQTLADGVGTTREAVARALGELRRSGAVVTEARTIRIADAEQLAARAHWIAET